MSGEVHGEEHAEHEHGKEHGEHGDGDHEEGGAVTLNEEQRKLVGVTLYEVRKKAIPKIILAPGVLQYNSYRTTDIATPMDVIVVKRHVELGEIVEKGKELVTVSSVVLGEAQADYLRLLSEYKLAISESKRLKSLSKQKIVSTKRIQKVASTLTTIRANLKQAKAHLEAFGLRSEDIEALKDEKKRLPFGQIVLRAKEAGTVVFDDFRVGQAIPAGEKLIQIVDESEIWVEAKLGEKDLPLIKIGQDARIHAKAYPKRSFQAKVLLLHHILDPVTRTVGVRLSAKNKDDALKPGMFVNVEIIVGTGEKTLMIPEEAVQRQGTEHIVFVEEEPGHYERREVETGKKAGGWIEIINGVKEDEHIVVNGAFTLLSELAKSGFEVHNH